MRKADRRQQGNAGERLAEAHLEAHGLVPITRNFRTRQGEIDLVMQDRDTLVFVEVRVRRSNRFGGALASVDTRKQQRILHAARLYLLEAHAHDEPPCRFDVVGITPAQDADTPGIDWVRDAFRP